MHACVYNYDHEFLYSKVNVEQLRIYKVFDILIFTDLRIINALSNYFLTQSRRY